MKIAENKKLVLHDGGLIDPGTPEIIAKNFFNKAKNIVVIILSLIKNKNYEYVYRLLFRRNALSMVVHLDKFIILDSLYTLEYFRRKKKKDSPLDILKMCFATREITKAQYLEHKKILETV